MFFFVYLYYLHCVYSQFTLFYLLLCLDFVKL